ncbi:MAG: polyprenyl synthetase family protein [Thermaerobacter sp.]|nr:polyprenyl synthetase family protein [Thermaerobacter sp.]
MPEIAQWLVETRVTIDNWIRDDLPWRQDLAGTVEEAMRYSLLAGGKRLRPQLVLAAAALTGEPTDRFRLAALAVEYLHTYSLIHDDLPAMDNDDLRRGLPTSHKVYGEAMAILAGDALLTEAWGKMAALAGEGFDPAHVVRALAVLSRAAGRGGLIRGQVLDLAAEHQTVGLEQLEEIHRLKTGALFEACCILPAVLQGDPEAERRLARFARHFGLAFQIVDDILNVIGDRTVLGKATGTDVALGKATYPRLLGIEEARRLARHHATEADKALGGGAAADVLRGLMRFAVEREW